MNQKEIKLLEDFGLSGLEAAAYVALLNEPGCTGYRLSHILNKPTANVYKALSSMQDKGLVTSDDSGKAREFFPVPVSDFIREQELVLKRKGKELEEELGRLKGKPAAAMINRLSSFEQVLQRATSMIESAGHIIVVDAFPEVLDKLGKLLERKASEGKIVIIHTYRPYSIPGCRITVPESDSYIWLQVPERAFDVAVDGSAFLISNHNLDYTEVDEALYSNHVYLSLMVFNSLAKGLLFYELQEEKGFSKTTRREVDDFLSARKAYIMENLPRVRDFFERVRVELNR